MLRGLSLTRASPRAAALVDCSQTTVLAVISPCALSLPAEQKRGLKFAKTTFGYKISRRGQRTFPPWRRPFGTSQNYRTFINIPHYWKTNIAKDPSKPLPRDNYITGEWTGLFALPRNQVFTLQHATSGSTVRMRRFPTFYTFNNPTRWLIGKHLTQWAVSRAKVVDEVSITKRQRMVMVKKGYLPKE